MNVRTLGTLGVAAALSLTACGSSSSAPAALTKADWVTQANAICKDTYDRIHALAPTSESDAGPAITKMAPISAQGIARLTALKAPAEIQSDVSAMVAAYQKADQGNQEAAAKVAAGDIQAAIQIITTSSEAGMAGDPIATRLGATECAKN